jgi:hypothetical protein
MDKESLIDKKSSQYNNYTLKLKSKVVEQEFINFTKIKLIER